MMININRSDSVGWSEYLKEFLRIWNDDVLNSIFKKRSFYKYSQCIWSWMKFHNFRTQHQQGSFSVEKPLIGSAAHKCQRQPTRLLIVSYFYCTFMCFYILFFPSIIFFASMFNVRYLFIFHKHFTMWSCQVANPLTARCAEYFGKREIKQTV